MITSNIRVACLNFQFWCTHKCLSVHQKCEETSSAANSSQSRVHDDPQHVLVTVSPNWPNAHACPSLFSHARGHCELNITSLASGQCCLSSSMSSGDFAGKFSMSCSCLAYRHNISPAHVLELCCRPCFSSLVSSHNQTCIFVRDCQSSQPDNIHSQRVAPNTASFCVPCHIQTSPMLHITNNSEVAPQLVPRSYTSCLMITQWHHSYHDHQWVHVQKMTARVTRCRR
jgi:hypothetical protein